MTRHRNSSRIRRIAVHLSEILAIGLIVALVLSAMPPSVAADTTAVKELIIPGEAFLLDGHPAFVLLPPVEKRTTPQPWVLYAPTLPGYPDQHEKWMHEQFLASGVAVAGIDAGEAYGSPHGQALMTLLYNELTTKRNFAQRPCLLGRSRGGLWVSSWAIANPDKVAGIAGIYPVFDLQTYPGLDKAASAYNLSPAELQAQLPQHNPIARADILAKERIPICIIHGDQDVVVPLRENSAMLADHYRRVGALSDVQLIVAHGEGHNFWEGFFRCEQLVSFVITRARAGAELTTATPNEVASVRGSSTLDKQFAAAKRVIFLGDSITHAGDYIAYVDAWILAQRWRQSPVLLDLGLPSETVSGLSEEGHAGGAFPRPVLAERLARILSVLDVNQSDLVVACYGMNCGIYEPFAEGRMEHYRQGMAKLKQQVTATGARLIVVTPPVYDDARGGKSFSYNEVLDRYSNWLIDQQHADQWSVLDLHGPMTRALAGRRANDAQFTFQPDAVHPNEEGHWFIASQIIAALGDPLASANASPSDLMKQYGITPEVLALLKQRVAIRRDAYVATIGHQRPGMPAGLPIAEAEVKADGLTRQIKAQLQASIAAPSYDVVVYGGTSAAITAAIQVRRMGKSVVIVSPDEHLGGLTAGGLGWTDSGDKDAIGGLAREFYHDVWRHYQHPDAWRWQAQAEFGNRNQSPPGSHGDGATMWVFEPHVAEEILEQWLREHQIPVVREQWLNRTPGEGIVWEQKSIVAIKTLDGLTFRGRMFIDATYEGDLMAAADISYHVGREANSVYRENWNGIQVGTLHHAHWFKKPVDPFVEPENRASGLLPRVSGESPGVKGEGDQKIQAYCYRMCLTQVDDNRIPFPCPDGYDPSQYELLLRVFDSGWREMFEKFDPIPNSKTDTNNHGPFSTDNIGMNYDYPDATYERRQEILAEHRAYQQGLMYFMANDRRVPEDVRGAMSRWGLARDEFKDNGGWPHQIYVREARRMVGQYVMTEHDCLDRRVTPDSIGMGSYILDSHNVQRYVTADGKVQNEGDIGVAAPRPYEIAYGAIVPQEGQCGNLLVPVCLSSSHIAYGSIRMEPVFMILGQSAGTAACMAIDQQTAVQLVPYEGLRDRLLADGQVLELEQSPPLRDKTLVVWVAPANLTQRGGSALTLEDGHDHFDGIVFGEIAPAKWMAGSDFYKRTNREQADYAPETADRNTLVQLAITYRGHEVTVWRNGEPYARQSIDGPLDFGPECVVNIGKRHGRQGDSGRFAGAIDDARIYDRALSADELMRLVPNQASQPIPWAWWDFSSADAQERTGRFVATELSRGATVADGKLILDGTTGNMRASTHPFRHEIPTRPVIVPDAWLSYHLAHPGPGTAMPGDPNCAFFWKGRYHLHYIYAHRDGFAFAHVSSTDMVHWKWHPTTLTPTTTGHGMFSGTGFVTRDGRPAIIYHGEGSGRNQIAIALDDNLEKWSTPVPLEPNVRPDQDGSQIAHWDPDAWLDGEAYYALSGGNPGSGKPPTLFRSADLKQWDYLGLFMDKEMPDVQDDEDVSCPNFFRLGNKWMLLCISHNKGCRYYLGDWKNEKFSPDFHARMNWNGWDCFAPESLLTPDGRRVMWAWSNIGAPQSGIQTIPRELSLPADGVLRIKPLRELQTLRADEKSWPERTVTEDNRQLIDGLAGNQLEVAITFEPSSARQFGVAVYTDARGGNGLPITVDPTSKTLIVGTMHVPFEYHNDRPLTLRVFLDHNLVEIFADERQAVVAQHTPPAGCDRLALYSVGGNTLVSTIQAWQMGSIYEPSR